MCLLKIGRVGDGKKELRTLLFINNSAQKYLERHLCCSALVEPIGGDYSDSYYFDTNNVAIWFR